MTYGTYTPDMKACGLSGVSLAEAKQYCFGDHVVCSERDVTCGWAVRVAFTDRWEWRLRRRWSSSIDLGFIHISWERLHYPWADKVVWTKEAADA